MKSSLSKCSAHRSGQRTPNASLKKCSIGRLTNLPDELICQILSLLPTKDAAVASLSCRKMRSAFTLITALDFDDSTLSYCAFHNPPQFTGRFQLFKMFVNNVLQKSKSPHLSRFRLRFGGDLKITGLHFYDQPDICGLGCFPDMESSQLSSWIGFPLSRSGVRELDLCIHVRNPGMLPSALLDCETLEVLKLDTNLDFKPVSRMTSFRLRNLKVLQLSSILIPEDDFVNRLVSSCPLLEELYIDCWWKYGKSVTLSSTSLRILVINLNRGEEYSDLLSFECPNLQYLKYTDLLADHYSIASMKALVKASFHIWDQGVDEPFESMLSLVRVVSNVQRLSMMLSCLDVLDEEELKNQLPTFHNLTHLKLGHKDTIWTTLLLEFLKHSPILETLEFPRGLFTDPHPEPFHVCYLNDAALEQEFFRSNQVTPSCCKSYLKRIFIKKCWGSKREIDLIGFLLEFASVLEELFVTCESRIDKMLLESTLKTLPRASSTCLIVVQWSDR